MKANIPNIKRIPSSTYDVYSYEELFYKHSKIIYKFIYSFIRKSNMRATTADIEDIYQDIALKVIKNDYLKKFDKSKSSLLTWLNIICRTTTIDYYRKKYRTMTEELSEAKGLRADEPPTVDAFCLPEGILTDRQEEILTLFFKDGLNAGEIAARLGISPVTVRSIKFQALERLRKHHGTAPDAVNTGGRNYEH